jgi:hypothetical protein
MHHRFKFGSNVPQWHSTLILLEPKKDHEVALLVPDDVPMESLPTMHT